MSVDTEKVKPIEQVFESIKLLTKQMNKDLSDIKDDISFIKSKIDERETTYDKVEDKYSILDSNRDPTEIPKGWFW